MSRRSVHVVVELAKWVVVEIESVIGGCKLVGIKRTIDRDHLRRLHFFQLTSTSSKAVVNPSNVQQVAMVVVEQPSVVVVVEWNCQVESVVQRCRRRCQGRCGR